MDEYYCIGHCEYCTLDCATAKTPDDESDLTLEEYFEECDK